MIIRMLDIDIDKQAEYFNLGKADNPVFKYRAIHIWLKQPNIFKIQLWVLFRQLLYPMITDVEEVQHILKLLMVGTVAGLIILFSRVFDGVTDIVAGILIDRYHFKEGMPTRELRKMSDV